MSAATRDRCGLVARRDEQPPIPVRWVAEQRVLRHGVGEWNWIATGGGGLCWLRRRGAGRQVPPGGGRPSRCDERKQSAR